MYKPRDAQFDFTSTDHQVFSVEQSQELTHLKTLCGQARDQADQIGTKLKAGAAPDTLVTLLKTQADTIVQFQTRLAHFAQSGQASAYAKDIEDLKNDFQILTTTADKHLQQAQQKGVRLPGIGGKKHIPNPRGRSR